MEQLYEFIKMAIENIKANKGRSALTMLGIIIGISSVIMIMSIGAGASNIMNNELSGFSDGYIKVYLSKESIDNGEWITQKDMEAIKEKVSGVTGITPLVEQTGTVYVKKGEFDIAVFARSEAEKVAGNKDFIRGSYFAEADVQSGRRVCVIEKKDAIALFGTDDVVGMEVDITLSKATQTFTVVGVYEEKRTNALISAPPTDKITVSADIPFTALSDFNLLKEGFERIEILVDETADTKAVVSESVHLLESRHLSVGKDFFRVEDLDGMIGSIDKVMNIMTAFISLVAGISLLVGGIGVMNIMLVSVTERTKEIGIRKSLGAKTSSVITQFLAESAIITALGGVIGIVFGLLGAFGICAIIRSTTGQPITPGVQISTILSATLFSSCIGIFFGIYPAKKAAKLSPIEALRRN